jgi:twitching motility protein PilT
MTENKTEQGADPAPKKEIDKFFATAQKNGASDLHIKAGEPPLFRIKGALVRAKLPPFTPEQVNALLKPLLGAAERKELEERGGVDFAYSVAGSGRFRVNVFRQRGCLSLAARTVKMEVPTLEQLNLPSSLNIIPSFESGLVLVAGATGMGKSTTLSALLQIVNQTQPLHIVTIEDPIEFYFTDAKGMVSQREVGIDVPDFANGLRHVMRQDPDVIMVGEMRDAETFEAALMAAETGHLVFGTTHASSAAQTVGRVLDYFPPDRHHQIRQLLFFTLRAVIVQKLVKSIRSGTPRVPAVEVMIVDPRIKKFIYEKEDGKIPDVIRASRKEGMQDFNQSLHELVKSDWISEEIALEASPNPDQLEMNLKGISLATDRGLITG